MNNTLNAPKNQSSLTDLAAQINAEHAACESAIRQSLQHARNCGRLLNEAKSLVQHGEWGKWLAGNFNASERTAQAYMRVAKRWPEIEAKAQNSADLSIDGALALLSSPQPENEFSLPHIRRFLDGLNSLPTWPHERAVFEYLSAAGKWLLAQVEEAPDDIKTLKKLSDIAGRLHNAMLMIRVACMRQFGALIKWANEHGIKNPESLKWLDDLTDSQWMSIKERLDPEFVEAMEAGVL